MKIRTKNTPGWTWVKPPKFHHQWGSIITMQRYIRGPSLYLDMWVAEVKDCGWRSKKRSLSLAIISIINYADLRPTVFICRISTVRFAVDSSAGHSYALFVFCLVCPCLEIIRIPNNQRFLGKVFNDLSTLSFLGNHWRWVPCMIHNESNFFLTSDPNNRRYQRYLKDFWDHTPWIIRVFLGAPLLKLVDVRPLLNARLSLQTLALEGGDIRGRGLCADLQWDVSSGNLT